MFRRLFTLELSAFREQFDDLRHLAANAEDQIAETAREVLAVSRHTASLGIWHLRRPV